MESQNFAQELINLGSRIKQLRKHRKLLLLDLELLSGVNDSDISRYERGKENIEFHTIFKLASALQVATKDLFDFNGPLPDNTTFRKVPKSKKKN